MRVIHTRRYKDYNFFVNPQPAPGAKFYGTFSVHRTSPGTPPTQAAVVCQEGWDKSALFDSEQAAIENAERRAKAWIDAQAN